MLKNNELERSSLLCSKTIANTFQFNFSVNEWVEKNIFLLPKKILFFPDKKLHWLLRQ